MPPNPVLFLGRFHPLLVHLPIGFLTLLALLELANRIHRFKHAGQARGMVLAITAAASVVSVVCGLLLASGGGYDGSLLFWHKWMGILLASFVIATSISFWFGRHKLYTGLLVATLALMAPASHFGGSMTHGKAYLTEYAPRWLGGPAPVRLVVTTRPIPLTDPLKAELYPDLVRPILAENCLACHNGDKSSGGLRLDSIPAILKGGSKGPAIAPHDADHSLIVQRILLPTTDPKHMPPEGKPQPTDDQIALLRWWIESGAVEHAKVAQLDPSPDQIDLVVAALKLPKPIDVTTPRPLADLVQQIDDTTARSGAEIQPVAADQPWIAVNAAIARSFGDADLLSLAPIGQNIGTLNLAGTKITDAGMVALQQMPNLQELRLERTAVTDTGLKNLTKLRKLSYLNLYGTAVTSASLETLRKLPNLHRLYLWRTRIDPDTATKFAESKTDQAKIARMQQQIAALQTQIIAQHMEVITGVPATTKPVTMPAKTVNAVVK